MPTEPKEDLELDSNGGSLPDNDRSTPDELSGTGDLMKAGCDCEKELKFRKYEMLTEPALGIPSSEPTFAPKPKKSDADQRAGLLADLQTKLEELNNRPEPKCAPTCSFLGKKLVEEFETKEIARHEWTEKFELLDKNGKKISGVAKYKLGGRYKLRTMIYQSTCGIKDFGANDESRFDPEVDVNFSVSGTGTELFDALKTMSREQLRQLGVTELS